jgi:hypothetical protein
MIFKLDTHSFNSGLLEASRSIYRLKYSIVNQSVTKWFKENEIALFWEV